MSKTFLGGVIIAICAVIFLFGTGIIPSYWVSNGVPFDEEGNAALRFAEAYKEIAVASLTCMAVAFGIYGSRNLPIPGVQRAKTSAEHKVEHEAIKAAEKKSSLPAADKKSDVVVVVRKPDAIPEPE